MATYGYVFDGHWGWYYRQLAGTAARGIANTLQRTRQASTTKNYPVQMSVVSLLKNPALGNEEPLKIFEQRGNIHSLKHLHSDFYVPGAVLDTRDAVLN